MSRSNPNTLSKADICGDSEKLGDAFDHLNLTWLGVDRVINNLATHISGNICLDDGPVVTQLFRDSVAAYQTTLEKRDRDAKHHQRMRTFLAAFTASAKRNCSFEVVDVDTGDSWSVLSPEPYLSWSHGRTSLKIMESSQLVPKIPGKIYERIVPYNLKLAMRRFNHEATIVGHDLDSGH